MLIADSHTFKDFIRAIGRGQRAGRTLTQQEAFTAMSMMLNGQATAEQKGAFLMLLRVREETPEELAGFTQALRNFNLTGLEQLNIDLDLGCYAGKRRQLPWFVLAVLLLAQQGKRIFLHGTHEPDSNRLYLAEVLPALRIPLAANIEQLNSHLDHHGIGYMPLSAINPELDAIIQLRSQFGLRSCANTLARMLNPTNSLCSLQGVFHRHVDEKHAHSASLLNAPNVLCFRGEGGEVEYNPERDVTLHISRNGEYQSQLIPASLSSVGIKPKELDSTKLISFWCGHHSDEYGLNAVIGSLATMLVLMENISWVEAESIAKNFWQTRDKSWPFSVSNYFSAASTFDTTGKHYAH